MKQNRKKRKAESSANGDRPVKHAINPELRIMLASTALIFLLLLLTMVISNTLVMLGVRFGIITAKRPGSPLLPFLIQSGIISICTGTALTLAFCRLPLRPLNQLIRAIHDVAGGNFHTKIDLRHPKEFRDLSESFNQMTDELAGIEMLRSDFINNFSHEFRTPIMSVLGFARLLKKEDLSEEQKKEYLDIIISECRRLSELSDNVLNLSKVESLTLLTDTEEFNAGEQVRESILMLEQKWNKKKISFDLEIEEVILTGNRSLLRQVWVNLIDNAVKFSPDGSSVSISVNKNGENFVFTIKDHGPGINAGTCERIFDKFYQGDTSHATAGNGLGLSLVRRIVLLHRGTVAVKSQTGKGSIFIVTLPLTQCSARPFPPSRASSL